jgi:hypothetical protein
MIVESILAKLLVIFSNGREAFVGKRSSSSQPYLRLNMIGWRRTDFDK